MIIDIHTHTFPEKIAEKALRKLEQLSSSKTYVNGTADDLLRSQKQAGIDLSVIQPVVTAPAQHKTINHTAAVINETYNGKGLLSFGGIHPDCENYREILHGLVSNGIRGIKLHPVYQKTPFDDIRILRILDLASELGLVILTHAGFDIGIPGEDFVSVHHILSAIRQVHPQKLILAHMGGWECWDIVEKELTGAPVWFDTSFTLTPIRPPLPQSEENPEIPQMQTQQFLRIVQKHGAERILFGSDSPWSDQTEALRLIRTSGLSLKQLRLILGENTKKLLAL